MNERILFKQALQRIGRVGSLEEAKDIADTALSWHNPATSKVKCAFCPNMIPWDTCARLETREKVVNVCDDCITSRFPY